MATTTAELTGVKETEGKKTVSFTDGVKTILSQMYTLFYRQGNNPHPMQKNFFSSGKDLSETVLLAKKHCETVGVRFVRVVPFISNLRADERKHMNLDPEQE
jgi:hypothetical protein